MSLQSEVVQAFENEIDNKIKTVAWSRRRETTHLATVQRIDNDGTIWVHVYGGATETPIRDTSVTVNIGDIVKVVISNGVAVITSNVSYPTTSTAYVDAIGTEVQTFKAAAYEVLYAHDAVIDNLDANYAHITDGVIDNATIGYADINELDANYAHITEGVIDNATIDHADVNDLDANYAHITLGVIDNAAIDYANVNNLNSHYAHITEGVIDNATIDHADVNDLDANYAHISNGTIDNAKIGYADVNDLNANYAHISNGTIDNAKIGYADVNGLNANYAHISNGTIDNAKIGYADVNDLNANYASINLANVNTAYIDHGVIRAAAIVDEQVFTVTGNKATLAKLDASKINVYNLRAENLIVSKINGQPVLGNYEAVNENQSGYSSKNPSQEGWYEFSASGFVLSTDTTVDTTKAYFTKGTGTKLYDQAYIDDLAEGLNQRIDGAIETWTGTAVPTMVTYPVSDWSQAEYDNHIGDIYYVVNTASDEDGFCYRFAYDNTSQQYGWVLIKDSDVTKALQDITDLQDFESDTTSWIEQTDEGLRTIRQNHTTLSGVVDKTVKSTVQLWFTKANTTAPSKPTSKVTSTSTDGNAWRVVVPAWNASYPNYYFCYQMELADGTFAWSDVVRDIAMGESQGTSRDAQTKANADIQSSVQLWYTSNSTTPPAAPSAEVTSTATTANQWTTKVPTYASATPKYHYCYQQKKGNGTFQWTTPTYDDATTTAMAKAQAALPSSTFTTFQTTTFKELVDEVDEQSSTITTMSERIDAQQAVKSHDGEREIITEDAADMPLLTLINVLGESVQNGTPTPTAPKRIQAVRAPARYPHGDDLSGSGYEQWRLYGNTNRALRPDGLYESVTTAKWAGIGILFRGNVSLEVGDKFCISVDVRNPSSSSGSVACYAMENDAGGTRVYTATPLGEDGSWASTSLGNIGAGATTRVSIKCKWTQSCQDLIDAGGQIDLTFQTTTQDVNLVFFKPILQMYTSISPAYCYGEYVPYGHVGLVSSTGSVTYLDLKGNELHALDETYRDTLNIDASGHALLEKRCFEGTYSGGFSYYGSYNGTKLHYIDTEYYLVPAYGVVAPKSNRYVGVAGEFVNGQMRTQMASETKRFYIADSSYSSAEAFNAFVAQNPVNVVLPLAERDWHTVDLGYVDLPTVSDESTVYVAAEVQPVIGGTWWTKEGGAEIGRTVSSTVNAVKQTADSNEANLSRLTATLGTSADGSSQEGDIVHEYNRVRQDLGGLTTKVGRVETSVRNLLAYTTRPAVGGVKTTYWGGTDVDGAWYVYHAESTLTRTTDGIRIDHAGGANGGLVIPLVAKGSIANGEKLTLSFDCRTNHTNLGDVHLLCDPTPNANQGKLKGLSATGSWEHFEASWTVSGNSGQPWALLISYVSAAGKYLEIRDGSMILERGDLSTRVTSAETSITQTADAIGLTATGTATIANPNLSPFFESLPYRTATTYNGGYWQNSSDNWLMNTTTYLSEGWAHVVVGGSGHYELVVPRIDSLAAGDKVTILFEWRNVTVQGTPSLYARNYPVNSQLDQNSYSCSWSASSPSSGSKYVVATVNSTATGAQTNWNALINLAFNNAASASFNGDLRISVYKGEYTGPYKPYSGNQLYASQAELKVANDAISARVEKSGVIASINASVEKQGGSFVQISADKVNIAGAAIFSSGGAYNTATTVVKSETQWYSSTSATSATGGSWGTSQPSVAAGRFIWQRELVTYANGSTAYKPSSAGVCTQGQTDLSGYSTTSQMNSAITQKIDGLYTGNRNLLIGSMSLSTQSGEFGWLDNGGSCSLVEKVLVPGVGEAIHFIKKNTSNTYVPSIVMRNVATVEWGKEYVYGMDLMFDADLTVAAASVPKHYHAGASTDGSLFNGAMNYGNDLAEQGNSTPAIGTVVPANTWVHYEQRFKWKNAPTDPARPYAAFRAFVYGACLKTAAGNIQGWMRNPYLVEGNSFGKATWTPAPEELPKENLSPFFSFEPYNTTAGQGGQYWQNVSFGQNLVPLGDGWARYTTRDNTSGSSWMYDQHRPKSIPVLKPETYYTVVVELRNVNRTGNVYLRLPDGGQNSNSSSTISDDGSAFGRNIDILLDNKVCHRLIKTRKTTDDGYSTYFGVCTAIAAGGKATYDMRLSIYEGVYFGPYQPYDGSRVTAEQRIYRRQTASTTPTAPTSWVTASGNTYTDWTTKVPPLAAATTEGQIKYPYLYTTMQRKLVDGTVVCDPVLLDENATIIDGGKIITGSIAANTIKATVIDAVNNGTGTINAEKVNISDAAIFTSGRLSQSSLNSAYDSKGSASAVQQNLDNLEIGGRNFLTNTGLTITANGSVGGFTLTKTIPNGTDVIVSVQIDVDNVTWASSGNKRLGFELSQSNGSNTQYLGAWWGPSGSQNNGHGGSYSSTATSFHGRIWVPYKLTRDFVSGDNKYGIYIQGATGGTLKVSKPKFEVGSKPTDWSLAPEEEIVESQRVYYRSKVSGTVTGPSGWVTTDNDQYADNVTTTSKWTTKVTPMANGTGASVVKYPYLYTCVQSKKGDGSVENSKILLDDTTTIIDGGKIITGTVQANAVSASSGAFDVANIPNLSATKITSDTLDAARIGAGSIVIGKLASSVQTSIGNGDTALSLVNGAGSDNKVVNGAFINDGDKWAGWGSPTTRNVVQSNGKKWMHCVTTATAYQGYSQNHYSSLGVTVEPSTVYTVGITARGAAANTKVCTGFHWFQPSSTSISSQKWLTFTVGTTASRQYQTLTVPAGIDHFNIMVGQADATAQEFWITDVTFVKGQVNQEWFESSALSADSAKSALNYITADSSGIKIASASPSSATTYQRQTASSTEFFVSGNKRTAVNGDGLEVFDTDGSTSLAKFGTSARVGKSSGGHVDIDSDSVDIANGTTVIASFKTYTPTTTTKTSVLWLGDPQIHIDGFHSTGTSAHDDLYLYAYGHDNSANSLIMLDAYGDGRACLRIQGTSGDFEAYGSGLTAHQVFAAGTGATTSPATTATFRSLVADDIPSLAASKINSGTFDAARIPTAAVNKGGTGKTSHTVNSVIIGGTSTTGALQNVAAASGAFYSTGANVKPSFGTLPIAQGGTGQTGISSTTGTRNTGNTTAGTITCLKFGKVGFVRLDGVAVKSFVNRAGFAYLPTGYYPKTTWYGQINGVAGGFFLIDTDGTILLDPAYSNATLYGCATYPIA